MHIAKLLHAQKCPLILAVKPPEGNQDGEKRNVF